MSLEKNLLENLQTKKPEEPIKDNLKEINGDIKNEEMIAREVLKKVDNIIKPENAINFLDDKCNRFSKDIPYEWALRSIMECGILGNTITATYDDQTETSTESKYNYTEAKSYEDYKEILVKNWKAGVKNKSIVTWANILGRDIDKPVESYFAGSPIGVIYSLSKFKEAQPLPHWGGDISAEAIEKLKHNHFRGRTGSLKWNKIHFSNKTNNEKTNFSSLLNEENSDILEIGLKKFLSTIFRKININKDNSLTYDDLLNIAETSSEISENLGLSKEQYNELLKKCRQRFQSIKELFNFYVMADDGFVVGRRVAPRNFKGLIVNDLLPNWETTLKTITDLQKSIYDPKDLLPIYNLHGDLLWPEKIKHKNIIDKNII